MARRGSYAKGVAKREEILTTALDVIARNGYRRTSVRELADAVGLSQAGLLHYFSSKEELFQEILRKRDEVDADATSTSTATIRIDGFFGVIRHNSEVPGLVQLYAQVSTEACDPEHPAHAFFVERYAQFRGMFGQLVRDEQAAGRHRPRPRPRSHRQPLRSPPPTACRRSGCSTRRSTWPTTSPTSGTSSHARPERMRAAQPRLR